MKLKIIPVAATAALCAACASGPEYSVQEFTRAETGIEFAEKQGAREYAPTALQTAQGKLSAARSAAERGDTEAANRRAEEAAIDAQLAAARASRVKADNALDEIQKSIDTLQSEMRRNSSQ